MTYKTKFERHNPETHAEDFKSGNLGTILRVRNMRRKFATEYACVIRTSRSR